MVPKLIHERRIGATGAVATRLGLATAARIAEPIGA
jgi:hypothetical protein